MKEAVYQGHGQIESYSIDSALWGVIAHEQRHANFNKYISFLKKKDVKEDIKLTIQYKDGRPVPVKAYTEAKIKSSKKDEDFIKIVFLNFQIVKVKKEIEQSNDNENKLKLYLKLKEYQQQLDKLKKQLFLFEKYEYKKDFAKFYGIYDFQKYNLPAVRVTNPLISGYNITQQLSKDFAQDNISNSHLEKLVYRSSSYKNNIVNSLEQLYERFLNFNTTVDNFDISFYKASPNNFADLIITNSYNDGEHEININIKKLAKSLIVYSDKFYDPYEELGISGSFKLNGVEIEVDTTDSLYNIVQKINWGEDTNYNGQLDYDLGEDVNNNQELDGGTSQHGVYAYIENNRLFLKNMSTGDKSIVIDDSDNILHDFGVIAENPYNNSYYFPNIFQNGSNSEVNIDGEKIESDSNLVYYKGIIFNLKNTTKGNFKIPIKENNSTVVKKIENFANEYNKVMTELNNKLKDGGFEKSFVTLKLKRELTKAVFLDVEDKDVTDIGLNLKEEKNFITKLQLDNISQKKFNFSLQDLLYSIGITNNQDDTISINKDRLEKAVESNKENIYKLFFSDNGVINRLKNIINKAINTENGMIVNEISQISSEKLSEISELYQKEKVYSQFYSEKLETLNQIIQDNTG